MKFLMTFTGDPSAPPPTPEQMQALGKFTVEKLQSGTVLMTGGILRASKATKVKMTAGKLVVTDGPFPETKELIDGYAIIQAKDLEGAMAEAEAFMKIAGEGTGSIQRIFDPQDLGPPPHVA